MNILVTGAAGAIGSLLAERLVDAGHDVTGIDALTDYYSPKLKERNAREAAAKGVKMYVEDLVTADLKRRTKGMDAIFHLAAQPGISAATPFQDYYSNNVVATRRLLEAVHGESSLKMLFHISTSSVYGLHATGEESSEPKPASDYGSTKLVGEQLALSHNIEAHIPVCVLRLFSVYGERERPDKFFHKLIKAIHEDKEVPFYEGSGSHVRSYTYVGDILDGMISALSRMDRLDGEVINLGSDAPHTTGEAMEIVEEIMGKKAKKKVMPARKGDQLETRAAIGKAKSILGYEPRTSLKDGLKAEVDWCINSLS